MVTRYRTLNSWLKGIFGSTVRKISVDAGLGCPNRPGGHGPGGCIYCNQRGSGTGAFSNSQSVTQQIERGIQVLSSRYKTTKFIAYFQSYSNTYAPLKHLEKIYTEATNFQEIVGLSVGTRPDCVSDEVVELLSELNSSKLVWVELGLQSMHEKTLRIINRGHDFAIFAKTAERLMKHGIHVVTHLILGLPQESVGDMIDTARAVSSLGVSGVKLHPLYVVKNTVLENMYNDGLYQPLTMEQSITATLEVAAHINPDIVIHRLTSDPHRDELVAPDWMLDKRTVRARLESEMERIDFWQGAKT